MAEDFTKTRSDYQWLGNQPREDVLNWLLKSTVTVNSSLMEGSANSIVEAILCNTPVLATDVPGNRGLLGEGYSGYFPASDERALHRLLEKIVTDESFLMELTQQINSRQHLFSPEQERANWLSVLAEASDPD